MNGAISRMMWNFLLIKQKISLLRVLCYFRYIHNSILFFFAIEFFFLLSFSLLLLNNIEGWLKVSYVLDAYGILCSSIISIILNKYTIRCRYNNVWVWITCFNHFYYLLPQQDAKEGKLQWTDSFIARFNGK